MTSSQKLNEYFRIALFQCDAITYVIYLNIGLDHHCYDKNSLETRVNTYLNMVDTNCILSTTKEAL